MLNGPEGEVIGDKEYLEKYIEPDIQEDRGPVEEISFNHGERFDYQGHDSFEGKRNNVNLSFNYSPADLSAEETQDLLNRGVYEEFFSGPVFQLGNFRLTSEENDFNFRQVMGREAVVLFNPEIKSANGQDSYGYRAITLMGDLTDMSTIVSLLHESGHFKVDKEEEASIYRNTKVGGAAAYYEACITNNIRRLKEKNDSWKALGSDDPISPRQARLILENERKAWAFALTKLKPFLDRDGRQSTRDRIHKVNLGSYSEAIQKKFAREWMPIASGLLDRIFKRKLR